MAQFGFIKSVENDKFLTSVWIDNFSIAKALKNLIILVGRVDFNVFNVFFVKNIFHSYLQNFNSNYITKADCDIYVAVDKQVGICYLIPMSFADSLNDEKCNKVKLSEVAQYKENWEIIKQVASRRI